MAFYQVNYNLFKNQKRNTENVFGDCDDDIIMTEYYLLLQTEEWKNSSMILFYQKSKLSSSNLTHIRKISPAFIYLKLALKLTVYLVLHYYVILDRIVSHTYREILNIKNHLPIIGKQIISQYFDCSCGTQPKRILASYKFKKSRRSLSRWSYREKQSYSLMAHLEEEKRNTEGHNIKNID